MELKKEQREQNLLNAFKVIATSDVAKLDRFKTVFLVDDVYTTGSTMEECAKVLKEAGAKKVWALTLAREE